MTEPQNKSTTNLQAIDATFYNITDANGQPTAGLLVLLDRLHRPVRAEVHLHDDIEAYVAEDALDQAQRILQERYYSREPVPLRILQTFQSRTVLNVPLDVHASASPAIDDRQGWSPLRIALTVAGVALVILLMGWGLSSLFGSDGESAGNIETVPLSSGQSAAPAEQAGDQVGTPAGTPGGDPAEEEAGAAANDEAATSADTRDASLLPSSRNASPDLGIGLRVRIRPGLKLALRSEAGATSGTEIGYMEDAQEAIIVAGPKVTQGESDTIIWWYVRLDSGQEAWAAANTSQFTLLELAP